MRQIYLSGRSSQKMLCSDRIVYKTFTNKLTLCANKVEKKSKLFWAQ